MFWIFVWIITITGCLYIIKDMITPIILSGSCAYIFQPVTNKLSKFIPRWLASLILTILLIGFLIWACLVTAPIIYKELIYITKNHPPILDDISHKIDDLQHVIPDKYWKIIYNAVNSFPQNISPVLSSVGSWMMIESSNVIYGLSMFFVMPFFLYFSIKDGYHWYKSLISIMPKSKQSSIIDLVNEINKTLSVVGRGQAIVCTIDWVYYSITLSIIKMPYAIGIGAIVAYLSFIPFLGTVAGGVILGLIGLSVCKTVFDYMILVIIFIIGMLIDGSFLTPKLIGDRSGLNPVAILLIMYGCGICFGFIGILMTLPLVSIVKVLGERMILAYKRSDAFE
jgi:predicted PurR-regulated permease PerM